MLLSVPGRVASINHYIRAFLICDEAMTLSALLFFAGATLLSS